MEGFAVAFNKNDIQDKDNLETLMDVLRDELRDQDFDILAQADNYRTDKTERQVKKIVSRHDEAPKAKRQTVIINTKSIENRDNERKQQTILQDAPKEEKVINEFKQPDLYNINGKTHRLIVKFIDRGSDLCWLGVSKDEPDAIVCNINVKHDFFKVFGEPTDPVIALLKTVVIARYTADSNNYTDNDKARAMMALFNEYIKKTKV